MALKNFQFDSIIRAYNRRQMEHKHTLDLHIEEAYRKIPALAQLDAEEADISVECAAQMIEGDPGASERLQRSLADISMKRQKLLAKAGFPEDYLTLTYDCPLCQDTGFDEQGRKCVCFCKAATELLYEESNHRAQYEKENFDTFDIGCYDPDDIDKNTGKSAYELAKSAYKAAWKYVQNFPQVHGSLVLYGPTGVGKTFLSNCIARELIENIYSVVHLGAIDFFEEMAAHQFKKEESDFDEPVSYDAISQCDLLIIDDLGTEITNNFVVNCLCQVVDTRLAKGQGTIITTNLELTDLQAQYYDRTFSRLISGYTFLRMTGKDIRFQKKAGRKHRE